MKRVIWLGIALLVVGVAPAAWGQTAPREAGKIALAPRATEKPDLTFMLLPRVEDTKKGNAAMKYMAAAAFEGQPLTPEEAEFLINFRTMPLASLSEGDARVRGIGNKYRQALSLLREGSRLDSADWETDVRQAAFTTLVPALGKIRHLAGMLVLEIRLDIKRHDWSSARDKLQTGYMLAIHMGEGETLIESLVGIAIASLMNNCLEDWIAEGGPNLYWPLSNLPAPFNDVRRPMSFERAMATISMPEMKQMREGHFSPELWAGLVKHFAEVGQAVGASNLPGARIHTEWMPLAGGMAGAALYPEAKKFLMARGMSKDEVEKMAVAEALGRYWVRSYDELSDDMFKWSGLPAPQAIAGMKEAEKELVEQPTSNPVNLLARTLLPSLSRARFTAGKLDRQIAAMRVVEAIRAYAAEKGELPESLEAPAPGPAGAGGVAVGGRLPVPLDPSTGRAFEYMKTGDKAVIASFQPQAADVLNLEITLKK